MLLYDLVVQEFPSTTIKDVVTIYIYSHQIDQNNKLSQNYYYDNEKNDMNNGI